MGGSDGRSLRPAAGPGSSGHDARTLHALALAARAKGQADHARSLLLEAVALDPGFARAHADLAQLLQSAGRSAEALRLLDSPLRRFGGSAWPLSIKAAILDSDRRTDEALPVHEQIVERIPEIGLAWLNYGQALRAAGRSREAIAAYRRAIALEPANGAAWWALASIRTEPLQALHVEQLESALGGCTEVADRVPLHFALARALEDVGDFEGSFGHYAAGNRLRTGLVPPQSLGVGEVLRANEALLSRRLQAGRMKAGRAAECPVFIVGMPRSGSTLVEQILACHPEVEALGELPHLLDIARAVGGAQAIGDLRADRLAELGEAYLASARRYRRTDRLVFTDKLPANWRLIGLISLILPEARIIDVRRDPVACCFANFAFYFNRTTNLAAGLEDLARYYSAYARLTDRFAELLPDRVRTLRYESLVEDPAGSTRSLLDFLRLPFHPDCLHPSKARRAVHTPSAEQVHQPISGGANRRWRPYAPWLSPLIQAFATDK